MASPSEAMALYHYPFMDWIFSSPIPLSIPDSISRTNASKPLNTISIELRPASSHPWNEPSPPKAFASHHGSSSIFYWPQEAFYEVLQGQSVHIYPLGPINPALMELSLLGPISCALLHQQKRYALHGSAVSKEGKAIAFLGHSGLGKSTLAAHFVSRGYEFLSDDVLLMDLIAEKATLFPSVPSCKLDASWTQKHSFPSYPLSQVHAELTKHKNDMTQHWHHEPTSLSHIYCLEPSTERSFHPLKGHQSYFEILKNTHTAKWLSNGDDAVQHLKRFQKLLHQVPITRINYPQREQDLEYIEREVSKQLKN